jgi:hypothetical protein
VSLVLLGAVVLAAALWCWPRTALALPAARSQRRTIPPLVRIGAPLRGRIPPPRFAGPGLDPRAEELRAGSLLVFGGSDPPPWR